LTSTLTAGTGLISGDDHMDLCYVPPDVWQERIPARWREEAPRVVRLDGGRTVWVKEGRTWGIWGSKKADGRKVPFDAIGLAEEPEPGVFRASSPKYRLQDMDTDGLYAQVIYNFLNWVFEDQELKAVCLSAFNTWMAEFCLADPNRLVGLAVLPSHDPEVAVAELHRSAELGLRGAQFDVFGATLPIHDRAWDRLWAVAEETDTVISVHIGSGASLPPRAAPSLPPALKGWQLPASAAITCMSLNQVLADITMSGLLERHPRLRFVLGESSIGWIPFVLERLDFECENYKDHTDELPATKPSDQFRRNIYCTFQDEEIGVTLIPHIGEDNVMWAADYPHGDGSFPHSRSSVERIFSSQSLDIKRKATRDTARRLYGIC
jgi:predicted TIM-barrel fold metal-dependent hydrolase